MEHIENIIQFRYRFQNPTLSIYNNYYQIIFCLDEEQYIFYVIN